MDIEKLIEQLNDFNENHIVVLCGSGQCACGYLCDKDDCIVVRAATAFPALQAENEKLRADVVRFNDMLASYQNVLVPELRAELEQVTLENNALWTYIEIVDREYRRYMDRGYIDRLDELKKVWKHGQKED